MHYNFQRNHVCIFCVLGTLQSEFSHAVSHYVDHLLTNCSSSDRLGPTLGWTILINTVSSVQMTCKTIYRHCARVVLMRKNNNQVTTNKVLIANIVCLYTK